MWFFFGESITEPESVSSEHQGVANSDFARGLAQDGGTDVMQHV